VHREVLSGLLVTHEERVLAKQSDDSERPLARDGVNCERGRESTAEVAEDAEREEVEEEEVEEREGRRRPSGHFLPVLPPSALRSLRPLRWTSSRSHPPNVDLAGHGRGDQRGAALLEKADGALGFGAAAGQGEAAAFLVELGAEAGADSAGGADDEVHGLVGHGGSRVAQPGVGAGCVGRLPRGAVVPPAVAKATEIQKDTLRRRFKDAELQAQDLPPEEAV
jgi:hypothetical protein